MCVCYVRIGGRSGYMFAACIFDLPVSTIKSNYSMFNFKGQIVWKPGAIHWQFFFRTIFRNKFRGKRNKNDIVRSIKRSQIFLTNNSGLSGFLVISIRFVHSQTDGAAFDALNGLIDMTIGCSFAFLTDKNISHCLVKTNDELPM